MIYFYIYAKLNDMKTVEQRLEEQALRIEALEAQVKLLSETMSKTLNILSK